MLLNELCVECESDPGFIGANLQEAVMSGAAEITDKKILAGAETWLRVREPSNRTKAERRKCW